MAIAKETISGCGHLKKTEMSSRMMTQQTGCASGFDESRLHKLGCMCTSCLGRANTTKGVAQYHVVGSERSLSKVCR